MSGENITSNWKKNILKLKQREQLENMSWFQKNTGYVESGEKCNVDATPLIDQINSDVYNFTDKFASVSLASESQLNIWY